MIRNTVSIAAEHPATLAAVVPAVPDVEVGLTLLRRAVGDCRVGDPVGQDGRGTGDTFMLGTRAGQVRGEVAMVEECGICNANRRAVGAKFSFGARIIELTQRRETAGVSSA